MGFGEGVIFALQGTGEGAGENGRHEGVEFLSRLLLEFLYGPVTL